MNVEAKEKNILMVDDEEVCLLGMELMLKDTDYSFRKAMSGEECLEILRQEKEDIDILLLDIMMPDLNGLEVLHEIRKDKTLSKVEIILQTGVADNSILKEFTRLGINKIIHKPYNKEQVLLVLSNAYRGGASRA